MSCLELLPAPALAAGVCVGGRLIEGAHLIAGEWGHNPLPAPRRDEMTGAECYCGKRGCIETWISGPAIARQFHERTGQNNPGRPDRAGRGRRRQRRGRRAGRFLRPLRTRDAQSSTSSIPTRSCWAADYQTLRLLPKNCRHASKLTHSPPKRRHALSKTSTAITAGYEVRRGCGRQMKWWTVARVDMADPPPHLRGGGGSRSGGGGEPHAKSLRSTVLF